MAVLRRIATRRPPTPESRPGFICIDSVHQGNLHGRRGLYHINAVDSVTQWEIVASVETITREHMVPVLREMLAGGSLRQEKAAYWRLSPVTSMVTRLPGCRHRIALFDCPRERKLLVVRGLAQPVRVANDRDRRQFAIVRFHLSADPLQFGNAAG